MGFDNIGLQLGFPIDNTVYSLEASVSLTDFTSRIGWDITSNLVKGNFVVAGAGIEVNHIAIIGAGIVYGCTLYGFPINDISSLFQSPSYTYSY